MAVHLVTYDLRTPGKDYNRLYDALKRYTYCHGLESVWFIQTTQTAEQVRDYLRAFIDGNDRLFVTPVSGVLWASQNVPCADWINKHP